ncbi:MAG: hypothetical protein AUG51_17465 [Acidobacteria bacterium 13_1_20CM_3_53_8]|nr:MAG: hypothetical protein AUG51_17465 [Acidobacteria bacterium 13_1_20CM_3_53_8]
MRDRIAIILSIAALVVGLALFTEAQNRQQGANAAQQGERRPPPPPPPFALPRIEHLAHDLNLSDAQEAQIKSILDIERPVVDALMRKLDDAHKQMDAVTANGQFDETQVRALANQQAQTVADLIVEQERVKSKIYTVLTPEQRTEADERHRRGGPHPCGPGDEPPPPPPPPDN